MMALLPLLPSSLAIVADELARPRRKAEVLVFDLVRLADAPLLLPFLLPSLLFSLAQVGDEFAHHSGGTEALPKAVVVY